VCPGAKNIFATAVQQKLLMEYSYKVKNCRKSAKEATAEHYYLLLVIFGKVFRMLGQSFFHHSEFEILLQ